MKIEKIKDETLEKHFQVVIPAKDLAKIVDEELSKISGTIKMAGFRAGKVPITIVKKKYGAAVRIDTIESEVKKALTQIIKDHNINLAEQPQIDDLKTEEGKDLSFVVKLQTLPHIAHPDLKKIKIERPVVVVSDKDIDEYIQDLIKANPIYTKLSKTKAVKGDQVTIDFVGSIDGKEFEGGSMEDHKLVLGSGQFIPGFEDQLIGHKAESDVEVKVTFPENYHAKDLAGKEAVFATKIREVHKPEVPPINNELGKFFGFEDLEALKKDIENTLKSAHKDQVFNLVKMRLFDQLEKLLDFEVPSTMLENEFNMIKKQASGVIKKESSDKDQTPKTEEAKPAKKAKAKADTEESKDDEEYRRIALRRVRIGMYISDYAKLHALKVENRDLNAAVSKQARMFPGSEKFIIEYFTKNKGALESLKGTILEEKTVIHIMDNEAKVQDKEYTIEKVKKLLEDEENSIA